MIFRRPTTLFVFLLCFGCSDPATQNEQTDSPSTKAKSKFGQSGKPSLTFEVRRASREPVDGWKAATNNHDQRTIYLAPQTEFTNVDLSSTGVRKDGDGYWQIVLRLNEAATEKLSTISGELFEIRNTPRGLVAFIVDGEVLCAPITNAQITDGVIPLSIFRKDFSEQDANRIAKGIVGQ